MTPTPELARQALIYTPQRPRTHGVKVRDALQHVWQSQNEKTGWRAGSLESSEQMTVVTNE